MPEHDTIPTTAPETTWEIVDGKALPFSDEHGPAVIDGDHATCYSHTPQGALIATIQIEARILTALDAIEVIRNQTAPGLGQDVYLEAMESFYEEHGRVTAEPGELCQIAGFRFLHYDSDLSRVALASRCPDGVLQLIEATVQWTGDDWQLVLQDDGGTSPMASILTDLDRMTPWGGI